MIYQTGLGYGFSFEPQKQGFSIAVAFHLDRGIWACQALLIKPRRQDLQTQPKTLFRRRLRSTSQAQQFAYDLVVRIWEYPPFEGDSILQAERLKTSQIIIS
jgi:hypothetical protein